MQDEIEALIQENVGDLPNFRMGGTTTDFEADGAALGVAAETSPAPTRTAAPIGEAPSRQSNRGALVP